jgi:transposase
MFFVKLRTMTKNRVHALLDRQSEPVRMSQPQVSDLFGKAGREWMQNLELPPVDALLLKEMLLLLEILNERIKSSNRLVYKLSHEDPIARRLLSIPGLGHFLAVLIRAEIDDIHRFSDESKLHAYAGLAPSVHASGGKSYGGHLPKACNQFLKWALIEAVYPAIKKNLWLKGKYQDLAKRKPHNIAKAATARLLMTIVYKVWKQERTFSVVGPLPSPRSLNRVVLCHS